jgi:hypothetical protein
MMKCFLLFSVLYTVLSSLPIYSYPATTQAHRVTVAWLAPTAILRGRVSTLVGACRGHEGFLDQLGRVASAVGGWSELGGLLRDALKETQRVEDWLNVSGHTVKGVM